MPCESEILKMEGLALRLIPKTRMALYDKRHYTGAANQRLVTRYNREMVEEITENSVGGKYIITFQGGQTSQVTFRLSRCGVGETIEAAYQDYLKKTECADV